MSYSQNTSTNILSNQIAGAYRTVLLNYNQNGTLITNYPLVCQTFSNNNTIKTTNNSIFDGKGISNTIFLDEINETFNISSAPILMGTSPTVNSRHNLNVMDGLDFYFYSIYNLFNQSTYSYSMPLLNSCSLNITDNSASFNFGLT